MNIDRLVDYRDLTEGFQQRKIICLSTDCSLAIVGFVRTGPSLEQVPIEVWKSLVKLFPSDVGCIRARHRHR